MPPCEQHFRQVVDLDADRLARSEGITGPWSPERHREIATGTGRNRTEEVDLGQELEIVAFPGWAGFHEIAVILVKPSDLEDVEDVVDVRLVEMPGQHGPRQVRMAIEIKCLAHEELGHV